MALSDAEKARIRSLLGYSPRYRSYEGHPSMSIESAMNSIASYTEDESRIRTLLTELTAIDTSLTAARARLQAKAVGSITLNSDNEIGQLRAEGRRYVKAIAQILSVDVLENFYSGGSGGSTGGQLSYT
jgi:hypothetical protein